MDGLNIIERLNKKSRSLTINEKAVRELFLAAFFIYYLRSHASDCAGGLGGRYDNNHGVAVATVG